VATVNQTSGVATAVSPGTASIQITTTDSIWAPSPYGVCTQTPYAHTITASFTVSPNPHHVKVVVDNQGFPASCPNTGIYVRQIKVQVVDINNNSVTSAFSVEESYSNLITNTCGNNNPVASPCEPADTGGQFLDTMAVSSDFCNSGISQGSGCGFSLTSTWKICSGTNHTPIWTSTRDTRSNSVKVNGQTASYAAGTYLYP
jgi:hypothetical protein